MKAKFGGQNSITRTEGIWAELILNSARKSNKESNRLIGELLVLASHCNRPANQPSLQRKRYCFALQYFNNLLFKSRLWLFDLPKVSSKSNFLGSLARIANPLARGLTENTNSNISWKFSQKRNNVFCLPNLVNCKLKMFLRAVWNGRVSCLRQSPCRQLSRLMRASNMSL